MINNHKSVRWRRVFTCCLFFLSISLTLSAQDLLVTGKVTDGHLPISGANVLIKNTTNGVVTDFDGRYTITARPTDTLQISYLGYTTLTIPIQNRSTINVILKEDATALGEVQINAGYYTTTDRERTGSIARMTAKEIELQPVNNPLGAMQGHLSGVNIVQSTGVPGGGFNIEVRGRNFINGATDPLFIIDGVPFGSQSLGSGDVSGAILAGNISPLNAIAPNTIESIEVLKDGDATAIYGSRGANGVVLITTKKGKEGRTQFNADVSTTLGKVSHFLDLMNTQQYLEIRKEGIKNDGFGALMEDSSFDFIWHDVKSWDNDRYTDWQNELIGGSAYRNKAQMSLSGGNACTQFLISMSHQKETTVFPGDAQYKKTTILQTLNHKSENDRFGLNLSAIYSHERNELPRTDFTGMAYSLAPNAPALFDDDGRLNWENNTWNNPLAFLEQDYTSKIPTLMANAIVSYKMLPGLILRSSLGYNTYRMQASRTLPSSSRNPSLSLTPQNYSNLTINESERQSWIVEPQLHWRNQWNELGIDIIIGTTFQQETSQQLVQKGTGFPSDLMIQNLGAATTLEILEDSDSEYKYNAIFGRINFNLFRRYILNLTGRRDGSSRFGPGKQFGNFGALGMAWLFSKETFLKNSSILSFGKLRASYGTTGSDNIGDYRYLDTYKVTGSNYNGITLVKPTGIFNPLFGWEENRKLEAALELGFFKDRLLLNTSWYQNRSSNQLVGIPLAATTGFSKLTGNFDATLENSGIEIDLRTVNVRGKKLKWSTTFNLTIPKNKLVAFDGLETSTFANQYVIGKPLSIVKLYHSLGVDSETGKYTFKDYNGDGKITSLDDRQYIEDRSPKFYGGLGNTIRFGHLTFDFFLQFKKQKAFNQLTFGATPGFQGNAPVDLLDRWQEPGNVTSVQLATAGLSSAGNTGYLQQSSSAAFSDASFIRMRNISLNYHLDFTSNELDVNVYLQGQNLFTLTNYKGPDPEQPSNNRLPVLRQITLGLQVSF